MITFINIPSKEDDKKGFHEPKPVPQPTEKKGPLND